MNSVEEVFTLLGGPTAVARLLGVGPSTASEMKRRGSIPSEYWAALIAAGRRLGKQEITADALAMIHARPGDARMIRRQPSRVAG